MRKVGLGGIVLWAILGTLLPLQGLSATKAKPTEKKVDLKQHPTNGGEPVEVAVGLYITDFVAIDETRETFEFGGYLTARWRDARLAVPASEGDERGRSFRMEDLWVPS